MSTIALLCMMRTLSDDLMPDCLTFSIVIRISYRSFNVSLSPELQAQAANWRRDIIRCTMPRSQTHLFLAFYVIERSAAFPKNSYSDNLGQDNVRLNYTAFTTYLSRLARDAQKASARMRELATTYERERAAAQYEALDESRPETGASMSVSHSVLSRTRKRDV